jgi:uncharacterized short protein YbdD (DUF466 family)
MKALQFTCPTCGWSITTPGGMEDLQKHVMMHKDEHHPDMKMTQEQFKARVKEVEIMGGEMKKGSPGKITQKEESEAWRAQENIGKRM